MVTGVQTCSSDLRAEGRRTVPQIFVNGHGIGGCDEMYDLERKGQLDALLATNG